MHVGTGRTSTVAPLPLGDRGDRELLAALQRGDEASYEVLVRRHGGAMLAVARQLMRNEEDAREVVQDAFLYAFRSIDTFRGEARLSTWLHRIVVNAGLMRLRAAARRPEIAVDELVPQFTEAGAHLEPSQPLPLSVEAALESAEVRAHIRACVDQLPEAYRAVVVLRDFQDFSTTEAATALSITENAVKIRLHRAHQALRALVVQAAADVPRLPRSPAAAHEQQGIVNGSVRGDSTACTRS